MMGGVFHVKISWAQEKTQEQLLALFPKYLLCPWALFQTSGWLRFHWPRHLWEIPPGTCTWAELVATLLAKTNQQPTKKSQLRPGTVPKRGLGCSYIILGTKICPQNGNPGRHQGQRAAMTLALLLLPGHPECAGSICSWWASGQAQTWVLLAAWLRQKQYLPLD